MRLNKIDAIQIHLSLGTLYIIDNNCYKGWLSNCMTVYKDTQLKNTFIVNCQVKTNK